MQEETTQKDLTAGDLIDDIMKEAIADGASDVHIEPSELNVRIRFRIDGALREVSTRPLHELAPLMNAIKVMSDIDPTPHMSPTEGHFRLNLSMPDAGQQPQTETPQSTPRIPTFWKKKDAAESPPPEIHEHANKLDVRVSIFPTIFGEAVAMRLVNTTDHIRTLEDLGMHEDSLVKIRRMIGHASGMVLITGPVNAGKTTTIHAILIRLVSPERNIISLEDPVELPIPGIRQSEMHPDQGFTYASAMRSILRQDPDVLMVGEIRDPETAEYTVRASLAGRIVFSTVHTNSTIGAIARLLDMNIERSLIAYALTGVINQRLVRKICEGCKAPYQPSKTHLDHFNISAEDSHRLMKGKGCDACAGTGYRGRFPVYEILELSDGLRSLIMERAPMAALQEYAQKNGMKTLTQYGVEKALSGETTLDEVMLVI